MNGDKKSQQKGGAVFINDPIMDEIRNYCKTNGQSIGWFMARAGRILLRNLEKDPRYLQVLADDEAREKAASAG